MVALDIAVSTGAWVILPCSSSESPSEPGVDIMEDGKWLTAEA
jgi:hypothetical protein